MADPRPSAKRRWRPRTVDRRRLFNSSKECLTGIEIVVRVPRDGYQVQPQGATVTLNAYFSKILGDSYISKDTLDLFGLGYRTDSLPKRRLNPWGGVFKPIGYVELYVRQPSDNAAAPFKLVTFHVLEGSPSQDGLDLVIGESGCNPVLGDGFNFTQFNENAQRELLYELQQQQQQQQWQENVWPQQQEQHMPQQWEQQWQQQLPESGSQEVKAEEQEWLGFRHEAWQAHQQQMEWAEGEQEYYEEDMEMD
ncbi:hypothetical protein QC764_0068800 [Podospora pseudoanserina]|uniref:Uncharacterized protein n=1 Tax=Podospora pseudoanserina TaxID=2609844 RepID=A0ABR0IAT3_9PEZI|nr:hypothetical protein QC764_0068800 [Podospora pseudoanserina]